LGNCWISATTLLVSGCVMINGITLEEQIDVIGDLIDADGFTHSDGDLFPVNKKVLEAVKQTLEAEQKRRATNVLLNGGRK
jgi:hypothetical protein